MWEIATRARAEVLARGEVPIAVDIGVARGRSTILLAHAGLAVVAVSLWDDPAEGTQEEFVANARRAGAHGLVAVLRGDSGKVCERVMPVLADKVALLFVDGGHDYETVRKDATGWTPMMAVGGYALWHDYGQGSKFGGVNKAVDEWLEHEAGAWQVIGQVGYVLAVQRVR